MFSMGLQSGFSGRVFNREMLLSSRNLWVDLDTWHGALSSCSFPLRNCTLINGTRCMRSTSWQTWLFTEPLRKAMLVSPFLEIPAHTITLYGCYALAFGRGESPSLIHPSRECYRSCCLGSRVPSQCVFFVLLPYRLAVPASMKGPP